MSVGSFGAEVEMTDEDAQERPWPQVDVLAGLMRRELHANRHKRDWRYLTPGYLLSEVIGHVAKLSHAIEEGDRDGILEYAADVANLSMMVADRSAGPLVAVESGRDDASVQGRSLPRGGVK